MENLSKLLIVILSGTLLFNACGDADQQADAADNAVSESEDTAKSPKTTGNSASETLYPWVDGLNVRETPNTTGKVVAKVQTDESLAFMGEQSDQKETIVLRGVAYEEPWLKVMTKDKIEGWVFGGTVKQEGEFKGNAAMDDQHFNFAVFGNYNLKNWKKLATKDESGGDAEIRTTTYQKDNQFLEISTSEVGEYGYSRTHKLLDADQRLLKIRTFEFTIDPEFMVTEKVIDHTASPAKQYLRSQKISVHFMQLNTKPEMATGEWEISTLD